MATDAELEIHRALRESQNKHTYFLLGASGAAIALAVNQTQGASLTWSQIPLGLAVLAWGLSFLFGCWNRAYNSAGLYSNATLYDIDDGRHPVTGTNLERIEVGRKVLLEIFEDQSSKANRYYKLQFRFLVSGAMLYVLWHVLEMYLRTQ